MKNIFSLRRAGHLTRRSHLHPVLARVVALTFIALVFTLLSPYLRASQSLPLPEPSFNMDSGPRRQFRAEQVEEGPNMRKFILQESFSSNSVEEIREGERQSSSATSWRTLAFKEVAELWRNSTEFTEVFVDSLASAPFDAFFWESKPVTKGFDPLKYRCPALSGLVLIDPTHEYTGTKRFIGIGAMGRGTLEIAVHRWEGEPYEYVVVSSSYLASTSADDAPFRAHLAAGDGTAGATSFRNLGGDALLVAPYRAGPVDIYAHIAKFVRGAPKEQIVKLWDAVGAAIASEIRSRRDDSPLWLSTCGTGVYWLHVRLDSYPKYYSYTPYRMGER